MQWKETALATQRKLQQRTQVGGLETRPQSKWVRQGGTMALARTELQGSEDRWGRHPQRGEVMPKRQLHNSEQDRNPETGCED